MSEVARRRFNWRAFWSLLLAATVVGLPWTGFENHLLGFDGLTVQRHAWMSAHDVLALLFVVAVVAHLVLNGKALLRHARGVATRLVSREALVALALTAGLLLLFVGHAQVAGEGGGRGGRVAELGARHARD